MKNNEAWSKLGMGCMRLPKQYEEAEKLIMYALEKGINYYDTAYIYPGKEELLGRIVKEHSCRERVQITSKLPHFMVKTASDIDKLFNTTLSRLQTDYLDGYLIHMLPDTKVWDRLKELGIEEWLAAKKASGEIGKVGFSYHGASKSFIELLDVYPWEFVQIQYNYLDENTQAGRAGLMAAAERGIPVVIMEPLRGGLLANKLPDSAKSFISNTPLSGKLRNPAEWAVKWLCNQEAVTMVLSGMCSTDIIDENWRVCEETQPGSFTDKDLALYTDLCEIIKKSQKIGCTACSYCMPCPAGVNIPGVFNCYNESYKVGYVHGFKSYFMTTSLSSKSNLASNCVECGKCMEHCPQGLEIPTLLKKVQKRFENIAFKGARWYMKRKMLRQKDGK